MNRVLVSLALILAIIASSAIPFLEVPPVRAQTTHSGLWKTTPFEYLEVGTNEEYPSSGEPWWEARLKKKPGYSAVDLVGYNPHGEVFLSFTFTDDDFHGYFDMAVGWSYTETAYTTTQFTISITQPQPSPQTVKQGGSTWFMVIVKTVTGTPQAVTLAVKDGPPDSTVSWDPSDTIVPQQSGTGVSFTIKTSHSSSPGTYDLYISGTGGGTSAHSSRARLVVEPGFSPDRASFTASATPDSKIESSLGFSNLLPENVIIWFQVSVASSGAVVDKHGALAPRGGSGTASATSNVLSADTYRVSWTAYKESDEANSIAWSTSDETKTVTISTGQVAASIIEFNPATGTYSYGQSVTSSVKIKNTGSMQWTFYVGYSVQDKNGKWYDIVSSPVGPLDPGQATPLPVTKTWAVPSDAVEGFYKVAMGVWKYRPEDVKDQQPLDWREQANAFQVAAQPTTFVSAAITEFSPASGTFYPNQGVTSSLRFRNTGNVAWTFYVGYTVFDPGGSPHSVTSNPVTLDPGQTSEWVSKTWTVPNSPVTGWYKVVMTVWKTSPDMDANAQQLDLPREQANVFQVQLPGGGARLVLGRVEFQISPPIYEIGEQSRNVTFHIIPTEVVLTEVGPWYFRLKAIVMGPILPTGHYFESDELDPVGGIITITGPVEGAMPKYRFDFQVPSYAPAGTYHIAAFSWKVDKQGNPLNCQPSCTPDSAALFRYAFQINTGASYVEVLVWPGGSGAVYHFHLEGKDVIKGKQVREMLAHYEEGKLRLNLAFGLVTAGGSAEGVSKAVTEEILNQLLEKAAECAWNNEDSNECTWKDRNKAQPIGDSTYDFCIIATADKRGKYVETTLVQLSDALSAEFASRVIASLLVSGAMIILTAGTIAPLAPILMAQIVLASAMTWSDLFTFGIPLEVQAATPPAYSQISSITIPTVSVSTVWTATPSGYLTLTITSTATTLTSGTTTLAQAFLTVTTTMTSSGARTQTTLTHETNELKLQVTSNSTLSNVLFDSNRRLLDFTVSGQEGTKGFCYVTVAKELLDGAPIVLVDGTQVMASVSEDASSYYVYFEYRHSSHNVEIGGSNTIPEFPSSVLLLVVLMLALVIIMRRHMPRDRKS